MLQRLLHIRKNSRGTTLIFICIIWHQTMCMYSSNIIGITKYTSHFNCNKALFLNMLNLMIKTKWSGLICTNANIWNNQRHRYQPQGGSDIIRLTPLHRHPCCLFCQTLVLKCLGINLFFIYLTLTVRHLFSVHCRLTGNHTDTSQYQSSQSWKINHTKHVVCETLDKVSSFK